MWIQKKAKKRLESIGVKIVLNTEIEKITGFDILIWTGGVITSQLVSHVIADSYMRVIPHEDVFGVGDAIYCVNEKTGEPLPMTASVATREAKYVAKNILRSMEKKKLIKYKPSFPGFVIPLGGKYALFERGGFHFSGIFPWIMKYLISLSYWISILGFKKGFAIWKKGVKMFLKND